MYKKEGTDNFLDGLGKVGSLYREKFICKDGLMVYKISTCKS